jgi:tetratricopeptide (TPR) repeat protein
VGNGHGIIPQASQRGNIIHCLEGKMNEEAERYFLQSKKLRANEQELTESLNYLDKAIEIDPNNAQYYLARGLSRRDLDQFEFAIEDFDKVIQMTDDQEDLETAHVKRAVAYEALGDIQATLSDLDWLIENGFGGELTLCWRGINRLRSGYIEAAIEDYTQAYKLSPDNKEILLQRSHAYFAAKRYEDCIHDLSKIVEDAEKFASSAVYHWRGNAYYKLGKHIEALDDFNIALKLDNKPLVDDVSHYPSLIT